MGGGYVRCPNCGHGRPLRVTIWAGTQYEMCPRCHQAFRLVTRDGQIEEIRAGTD